MMADERDKSDYRALKAAIYPTINKYRNARIIDPVQVATVVLTTLDQPMQQLAAHLQIRQIAREMLRHEYEASEREGEKAKRQPFLPNYPLIQRRYPSADGKGYIKAELMSDEDRDFNIRILRGKGGKLLEHADQLEAWTKNRFRGGDAVADVS